MSRLCSDCGLAKTHHLTQWLEEISIFLERVRPLRWFVERLEHRFDRFVENLLVSTRFFRVQEQFDPERLSARSACFVREARRRNVPITVLKRPGGYTERFRMLCKGKKIRFEGLPIAEHAIERPHLIDDKAFVKERLKTLGLPTVPGRCFWFWQKAKAVEYGAHELGFPLVVKPRRGSFSRHITLNIRTVPELRAAIKKVMQYAPTFIVERYLEKTLVIRATVVDGDYLACVARRPANVVGDGTHTIRELVAAKNSDPRRGETADLSCILYKITVNETSRSLLKKSNYTLDSVPPAGEVIFLQRDPFVRLGADTEDVTDTVHPETRQLFRRVAKIFALPVVGIDFLVIDPNRSWREQTTAIIETNTLPCIEIHHFPFKGKPRNVAGAIFDRVLQYY